MVLMSLMVFRSVYIYHGSYLFAYHSDHCVPGYTLLPYVVWFIILLLYLVHCMYFGSPSYSGYEVSIFCHVCSVS
jgi:hypothetical protein